MNYAEIKPLDVANAKGISCTLFVTGCSHHCKGCFNEELQDFDFGKEWTKEVEDYFISRCQNPYVTVVSILGGEPFQQPYVQLLNLFKRLNNEVGKPIWVWTGYTFEQLLTNEDNKSLLSYVDILVDGKFVQELKDLKLKYKGSSNQRVIDVQNSLKEGKIILMESWL